MAKRKATAQPSLETEVCYREGRILLQEQSRSPILDEEKRTVAVAFSSETPVERYWGTEILDHSPESVDLGRIADGRAPLLVGHWTSEHVGVVEEVSLDEDRVGRAVVRFGRSARAEEIYQDVRDGIRSQISVGYRIHKMRLEESDGDREVYRATRWEPLEISIVAVAADPATGVGRAEPRKFRTLLEGTRDREPNHREERTVDPTTNPTPNPAPTPAPAALGAEDLSKLRQAEEARAGEILAVALRWNCREEGLQAIAKGTSAAEFKGWVLENKIRGEQTPILPPATAIGLSGNEAQDFSFRKLILALQNRDWTGAEFEREATQAAAKAMNRAPRGAWIPYEVLTATRAAIAKSGSGANLIATNLQAGSFIELLRNRMRVRALGARIIPGLVGDVAIPRQTGGATAAWVAEGAGSGDTPQTFDQVLMAAKTLRARSDMTRKMLLQSTPAIEELVRMDLATVLALELDRASIHGTGTAPEPRGVANVSGIGSVAAGANGGPPTWALIVALETEIAADNADEGALAYLTNAKVRGKTKVTEKATNTGLFLWETGDRPVNGYRAEVSNQVRSDIAKGTGTNLSAAFFGNWNDLLIGEWGTLDVSVDPYALGDSGGLVVRAFLDADVAVRHPESFALFGDIVTT